MEARAGLSVSVGSRAERICSPAEAFRWRRAGENVFTYLHQQMPIDIRFLGGWGYSEEYYSRYQSSRLGQEELWDTRTSSQLRALLL